MQNRLNDPDLSATDIVKLLSENKDAFIQSVQEMKLDKLDVLESHRETIKTKKSEVQQVEATVKILYDIASLRDRMSRSSAGLFVSVDYGGISRNAKDGTHSTQPSVDILSEIEKIFKKRILELKQQKEEEAQKLSREVSALRLEVADLKQQLAQRPEKVAPTTSSSSPRMKFGLV
jgi:phage shock protein A